jgi:hypothetical protein
VVIASDGVWDYASAEAVAKCVRSASSASSAAEKIVERVQRKCGARLRDDTTCMVMYVGTPSWLSAPNNLSLGRRLLDVTTQSIRKSLPSSSSLNSSGSGSPTLSATTMSSRNTTPDISPLSLRPAKSPPKSPETSDDKPLATQVSRLSVRIEADPSLDLRSDPCPLPNCVPPASCNPGVTGAYRSVSRMIHDPSRGASAQRVCYISPSAWQCSVLSLLLYTPPEGRVICVFSVLWVPLLLNLAVCNTFVCPMLFVLFC